MLRSENKFLGGGCGHGGSFGLPQKDKAGSGPASASSGGGSSSHPSGADVGSSSFATSDAAVAARIAAAASKQPTDSRSIAQRFRSKANAV